MCIRDRYSASSKFSKAKTVTVGKNTTVSKKISKLSGKKKYYVRAVSYTHLLTDLSCGMIAAGALLKYLYETQKQPLTHRPPLASMCV